MECFGSEEAFIQKLDALFVQPSVEGDATSPDISQRYLMSQYVNVSLGTTPLPI